jgi:hypothetical protein
VKIVKGIFIAVENIKVGMVARGIPTLHKSVPSIPLTGQSFPLKIQILGSLAAIRALTPCDAANGLVEEVVKFGFSARGCCTCVV